MFNPQLKPQPKEKPPRQYLQTKKKIKNKHKPAEERYFTHIVKQRDEHCQHPGCKETNLSAHHIIFKSQASKKWKNDSRNGISLCLEHHRLPHKEIHWRLYWEVWQVLEFGWWAGEELSLGEWVSRNELRLVRAHMDVEQLIKEVKAV